MTMGMHESAAPADTPDADRRLDLEAYAIDFGMRDWCGTRLHQDDRAQVEPWLVRLAYDDASTGREVVGEAALWRVHADRMSAPAATLRGLDADLGAVAALILRDRPAFERQVGLDGYGPHPFLVLARLSIRPAFRGIGLGSLLAARAIARLRHTMAFAAVAPAPAPTTGRSVGDEGRRSAFWRDLGFRSYTDTLMVGRFGDDDFENALLEAA
jgi:GNAT superfamily N-acetyltransferase